MGPPAHLTLKEVEQRAIEATLRRLGGNVKAASEALGIDRSTLYEKIKRYGIPRPPGNHDSPPPPRPAER